MEPVIATLASFVFGGLATYTICERRHRHRWGQRAPKQIRRTALWSIYMGQMALPGGLMGLFGLMAAGLGLVSIPGMILAIRIWRLGYAMLRRDPGAAQEAMKLRRFAVILNVATVAVAFVMVILEPGFAGLSLFLGGYALVSFAHAVAMERCAKLLTATVGDERTIVIAQTEPPAPHLRAA
jgi:hypothetical protein